MDKIGRNDPCPCGSGRKYKKCCLAAERAARAADRAARAAAPGGEPGAGVGAAEPGRPAPAESAWGEGPPPAGAGVGLHPYVVAKMASDPATRALVAERRSAAEARELEARLAERWSIDRVRALETQEIEARLGAIGVRHSRERFRELARERRSAWDVSEVWRAEHAGPLSADDDDFLGFAACALWERLLPERPSFEMVDDWMQEGYRLAHDEGEERAACDVWRRVWRVLLDEWAPPGGRSMRDVDAEFPGTQSFFNWAQDFELALQNASLGGRREYAELGRAVCAEWIERFVEEDALTQSNFRRALASFLFELGETAQGVGVLEEVVAAYPDQTGGYLALGDAYARFFGDSGPERDVARAEEYYRRGLAACRGEHDRAMFAERIEELARRGEGDGEGQARGGRA